MTRVSDPMFNGDIVRRVKELEAKVRELSAGRRLEAATVGAGGITVKGGNIRIMDEAGNVVVELGRSTTGQYGLRMLDTAGNVILNVGKDDEDLYGLRVNDTAGVAQVRAGQLASGGHGLEAIDPAGVLVALSTLAFGLRTDTVEDFEGTSSGVYTDLATAGPEVTVTVGPSGRALVIMTAAIDLQAAENGRISFEVSGATTQATDDFNRLLSLAAGATSGVAARATSVTEVDGLNDGDNTFTMKYRSGLGGTVDFSHRNITVLPY